MWIYILKLNEKVSVQQIKEDWEENHNPDKPRGISQAGDEAVITSTPRDSKYSDFTDEVDYVDSITEYKEIPNPSSDSWDPPYSVHPDGVVELLE